MSRELANLFAKLFIQRTDVRAIQRLDQYGEAMYMPELERKDGPRLPWNRAALEAHLAGDKTYGHYLLDLDDNCKLVAFDVDLKKSGHMLVADDVDETYEVDDLRAFWRDRSQPQRKYLKLCMNLIAQELVFGIESLGLPWAVAYSGNKGFHVYAFTGVLNAALAREAAFLVMEAMPLWTPQKGDNFYEYTDAERSKGLFSNFTIEIFPKQDSLEGKDLGNLMRLPLGRNIKSKDPSFFMDIDAAVADPYNLHQADALETLTTVAESMA